MPHDPVRITRTELALTGRELRSAARYLFCRPRGYGWHVAAGLVRTADRLDPEHEDRAMSQLAKNLTAVLDRLDADEAAVKQLTADNADLRAKLAATPVLDDEDRAAEARLADEAGKLAPPAAPPADVPAADATPPAAG